MPVEAQSEYRRLVHRMMLLENKRKSGTTGENKNNNIGEKSEDADAATKSSLVKKVLIRNASNSTSPTGLLETKDSHGSTKFSNTNVLRSYENLYVKIGYEYLILSIYAIQIFINFGLKHLFQFIY